MKFILITLLFIAAMVLAYKLITKSYDTDISQKDARFYLILIIISACFLKITGSLFYYERGDMGAFISWVNKLQADGFAGFYAKYGLCYPPLHIFMVYIIGGICTIFHIANYSVLQIMLIKGPALICDILTGYLLYRIGNKYLSSKAGLVACIAYLLNPAVIFNSSVWGQMDSIYTLCIVIVCYLIADKKLKPAYFVFGASILFKYQGIIFTPIIIFAVIDNVILDNCNVKKFFSHLLTGLGAIAAMIVCHLPFIFGNGNAAGNAANLASNYGEALTSFKFASVNAYNIWAMFGLNWHTQEDKFLGLTYNTWGTISIVLLVIVAFIISMMIKKSNSKHYLIAGFIISTMFMFSVRMHERYLFPALPLIFAAFLVKPCIGLFITYCGYTLMNFYNCAHVLFYYNPYAYDPKALPIVLTSFGTLITWIIMMISIVYYIHSNNVEKQEFR